MDLSGLRAFVTGAGQGIGRVISIRLAEAGASVALADVTDGTRETARDIESRTDGAVETVALRCDVTDESSVEAAVDDAVEGLGGLDVLVNNAGIAGPTAPVEDVSVAEFEETLAVNLLGPFTLAKHAAPHLKASDRGSVINVSSIGGKEPYPNRTPYASSKAGLLGLSRTLAHEFADDDVTVNTINPGPVAGQRAEDVLRARAQEAGASYEEIREGLEAEIPLGEMIQPEDVADMAVFLASDRARKVTAQDVSVDGGMVWW